MAVELAWVERTASSFVVRRATYRNVGDTFEMQTAAGKVVLVISGLNGSLMSDAEILMSVAHSVAHVTPYGEVN